MNVYDQAHMLARSIQESEEVAERDRLRAIAEEDETNRTLLKEYRRLQSQLQLQAVSGNGVDSEDTERFSKLASLLYMNSDVQAYLMSEMRVQKLVADLLKIVTDAAGMNIGLPE